MMQINFKFPSNRLLLSLFFCGSAVILLQNYNVSNNTSFLFNLICLVVGLVLCCIVFIPSMVLKKKYNLDFFMLTRRKTPRVYYLIMAFYSAYAVYTAEYFLLRYTDMFHDKYFSDAGVNVIAFIMIAICFYGACRGVNIITRFGIILFAFALLCYILIFSGGVQSLDFELHHFDFSVSAIGFISNTTFFLTPSFIAVIFAILSGYSENFKSRQIFVTLISLAVEFAAFLFFVSFALGAYADSQSYQTFLMSKISQISGLSGIESFYFALTTLSVFMIITLLLCCINREMGESKTILNVSVFSIVIFVLHICASYLNSVGEILTNPMLFNLFNIFAAFIIPGIYLLVFRRSENE